MNIQYTGNEQLHDTLDSVVGKLGEKGVNHFLQNLSLTENDFKIGKSRPETVNAYLLKVAAKYYNTTPHAILNTKNNHTISEARMICMHIIRKYTGLSCNEVKELYKLKSRGYVSDLTKKMDDLYEARQHNKELIKKYEIIEGQVQLYINSFGVNDKKGESQRPKHETDSAPVTPKVSENNHAASDMLNFTGEEPQSNTKSMETNTTENAEASVENSPFNHAVIERHNADGMTNLINGSPMVEDAEVVNETPAQKYAPNQIDDSALDALDGDLAAETVTEPVSSTQAQNEPGPMKFNPPSPGVESMAGGEGYQMPPEAAEALNKFSTDTIMGMAEAMLPRITFGFVEINEREVGRILETEDPAIRKRAIHDVKGMNKENLSTLDKEIRTILPYMKGPLAQMVSAEKLRVSPGLALAIYGIWLIGVLYIAMNRMAGERKKLLNDLRAFRDEKKPLY